MTQDAACIVLAGGRGTRLQGILPDLPKCLAPVAGRHFLEIQIETLAAQGVERFVLSLGYLAEQVIAAVEPLMRNYRIECVLESKPLGTGGAVLHAMDTLDLGEALATNGDTLLDAALGAMLKPLDYQQDEAMRIAVTHVADRARFGGVELKGARVAGFVEKGTSAPGPINAGVYRLARSAFDGHAPGTNFSLETQVMPELVARGVLTAAPLAGSFIDIGIPEDYQRFQSRYA